MAFEWLRDRSRLEVHEQALESNLEPLLSPRASQTHCTQPSISLLRRPSHYQDALLDPAELMQQIRAYRICSTCQLSTSTICRPYTYQAKARNPCSQRCGKWWGQSQPAATKSKSHNSLPSAPKLNAAKSLSPCGYLRSLRLRVFESFKDSEVTKRL
jgi:hypothetical protein